MTDESRVSQPAQASKPDEWQRANPLSMAVQMARTLASAIIPAVFVLYGAASSEPDSEGLAALAPYIAPILGVIIGLNLLGTWLGWVRLRYKVGDTDVRLEQGIISRSARSIPFERIQDVSLEQKLFPRLLGLVEVKFETGAGGKDELKLSYVSESEGERLRETVRALMDGEKRAPAAGEQDTFPSAAPVEPAGRTLFAMDTRRLFIFGLFSFSLVVFAVLLGALQQLEFLLPFDLWEYIADLFREERIAEAGAVVSGYSTAAQIVAILYALVTLLVVGMASGLVQTFVRDWEFRLDRTPKGFRRRRGLLTKTDVVMPVHRVQALVVKTGWLRRRFGWHGLSFISLAQDAGAANHDVAPFAKMEEIAPIAHEAGFHLPSDNTDWRRASGNFYFDRALFRGLFPATAGLVLMALSQTVPGLLLMAVAALLVLGEYYLWRFVRHAIDPHQVISRRGWLSPHLRIANRVKLHSVEITQHPLARWRGYCTLRFGLAGGRLAFPGLSLGDAHEMQQAVLDSIASVDFAKLPR